MRIIVNDTSCLIDLRKAGLLQATLLLPFQSQIALPLVHSELLDFTPAEFEDLQARGLEIVDLDPERVGRAFNFRAEYPSLSFNDCLSMSLAEGIEDATLLTGDRNLRTQAAAIGIEVHGVLWVSDQLETGNHVAYQTLHDALQALRADPVVFLPNGEIDLRLRRLRQKLGHRQ
jgi:predicted nucleic acid-binding protein